MSSVKKNFLYMLLQQFILMGLPFLTIPYISRILGPQGVGLYSYSFSIITLFINIFPLGSNLYAVREIAKVKDDREKLSQSFSDIFIIRTALLFLACLSYWIITGFVWQGEAIFYWQSLNLIGAFFDITWLFQGLENFKKVVTRNLVLKLLGFGSIFVFVKDKNDLILYTVIMGGSVILGNLALFYRLKQFVNFRYSITKAELKRHFHQMVILFIPSFSALIYSVLDKTMLGSLSTKSQVGYYEQSYKIVYTISSLINVSGIVMLPRTSSLIANKNFEKLMQVLRDGITLTIFLVLPITLGFIIISHDFVLWFLGEKFRASVIISAIMAPIIIFKSLGVILGSWYLVPMEKNKEYTLPIVFGAAVNFVLNILLIPRYGAAGAATATTFTEGLILGIQVWFLRDTLDLKYLSLKVVLKYFVAAAIMAFMTFLTGPLFDTPLFLSVVFKVCTGIVIYALFLLLIKDQLAIGILKRMAFFKAKKTYS